MLRKRTIDRWPRPKKSSVKLVVASASRTGTMGLYEALKILGYRSYHMIEAGNVGGVSHMDVIEEGVIAEHNHFSRIKRYCREEFDTWFAGYDAIVELPSYFGTAVIEAYLEDPDVKFLLTERTPASWARSFNSFIAGTVLGPFSKFPLNVAQYFHPVLHRFIRLNKVMYDVFGRGTFAGEPENIEILEENYVYYIKNVKRLVPKERILVIQLEEGLGWEQICPYLKKEVPKNIPYPDGRAHNDVVEKSLTPIVQTALIRMTLFVVPVISIIVYGIIKFVPPFLYAVRKILS